MGRSFLTPRYALTGARPAAVAGFVSLAAAAATHQTQEALVGNDFGRGGGVELVPAEQVWECGRCTTRIRTRGHGVSTPLHPCAGASGFRLPMVAEGVRADVRTVEREDYVGTDDVQTDDDGRPIMRAEVEHADGHTDVWAYAPTAHVEVRQ